LGMFQDPPQIGPEAGFRPYYLAGMEPLVFGVLVSSIVGIIVTYCTQPPDEKIVSPLFDAPQETAEALPAPSPTV